MQNFSEASPEQRWINKNAIMTISPGLCTAHSATIHYLCSLSAKMNELN